MLLDFLCACFSPPLEVYHTDTHAHTHAHAHIHVHTHIDTHIASHIHTDIAAAAYSYQYLGRTAG